VVHVRYCILGAGPSGLAFANKLKQAGITSFVLLDKEAVAGGLCRSTMVDGSPLDMGGGHFLDVRRQRVLDFLFEFMPRSEWDEHKRVSKIRIRGQEVDHPLEGNLWQLAVVDQIDFLESIARAGCVSGAPQPEKFDEWIRWKFGEHIANEYMLPYNRKIWCIALERLGTYWLDKLPSVSFRETVQSCLERSAGGSLPAHGTFLYPRHYGYGEVWRRMGEALGDHLVTGCPVSKFNPINRTVNGDYRYDQLVTTIPWPEWRNKGTLPPEIETAVAQLEHTTVDVDYYPENVATSSHWTYEPAEDISYHRLLFRHNFCSGARGYWSETNSRRAQPVRHFRHRNDYAYPVNTLRKPEAVAAIRRWSATQGILPVGRWGTWEHMNSDVAVDLAMQAAEIAISCAN
jgi:protoporphyrinogen oxidase